MKIIEANNVVYDYILTDENDMPEETVRAVDHVTLSIDEGSFVAILGRNGSGKSTFAKLLNGILIPTEGDLLVKGLNTRDEEHLLDIRRNVGMVFQNPDNQIIANVVEEDVAFGPENLGVPTEEMRKRVDEALAAVEMTEYRTASPNKLSGGQKQRVAIAGVMAMRSNCIVLDEPTAMLDPDGRKDVLETIHRLNRELGITVIIITHYMEEAVEADRVVVMEHGRVTMDGTPKEIFSRPEKLKNAGLDVPQVTELAEKLGLPHGIITVEELVRELTGKKH